MGRHHHNHHHHRLRLPEHLYLSSAASAAASSSSTAGAGGAGIASAGIAAAAAAAPRPKSFAASLLTVHSVIYPYYPSLDLLQETSDSARAVGKKIPGFNTSAAFLTTLRANLAIDLDLDSTPSSQVTTPDSLRPTNLASSTGSLSPALPSPLLVSSSSSSSLPLDMSTPPAGSGPAAAAVAVSSPLDGIPPLVTKPALTEDDRVDALKLVADSVAQQRQYGARAMIFHPITAAVIALLLAVAYRVVQKGDRGDWALAGTTLAGALMALLVVVRYFTRLYIEEAERVGTWKWLDAGRKDAQAGGDSVVVGTEDDILLTRYGDEAVGALILRGVRLAAPSDDDSKPAASSKRTRRPNSGGSGVTAVIRGFATTNRYRRRGIGTELLEEAIKLSEARGWQGPEFAADHANSARLLPLRTFDGPFEKRDRDARRLLERVKAESGGGSGGRSGSGSGSSGSGGRKQKR